MSDLIKGMLVRWTENKSVFGVVLGITERLITVEWDKPGPPPQFSSDTAPLQRYTFRPGEEVVWRSAQKNGVIKIAGADGVEGTVSTEWSVRLDGDGALNIAEADLRPHIPIDPMSRLSRKENLGSAKEINLALVARDYRLQHFNNPDVSLAAVGFSLKPHQVSVVHRVVHSHLRRFLLCDEVGLGKTIEAGMIFKELEMRGQAKRVLVIVPANLRAQWLYELKSKFSTLFRLLDTATAKPLLEQGENPFDDPSRQKIIVSEQWVINERWASQAKKVSWDLIIVDEAHHARQHADGESTKLFRLLRDLVDASLFRSRAVLLLTATPMQLGAHEMFALVRLLDPEIFPNEESIRRHQKETLALNRMMDALKKWAPVVNSDRQKLAREISGFLQISEQDVEAQLDSGRGVESLREQLSQKSTLSEVFIRNRKKDVGGFLDRKVVRWSIALTEQEEVALDAVQEYVRGGYRLAAKMEDGRKAMNCNLVMTVFQKLMASSIYALRCSLERRREKLATQADAMREATAEEQEEILDDDFLSADAATYAGAISQSEIEDLDVLLNMLKPIESTDSRAEFFLTEVNKFRQSDKNAKVLVFTQSINTQKFLHDRLRERGWGVSVFNGTLPPERKARSIRMFEEATSPHILISTEAGGEGRNLQFCHLLVNYDLPWNPMRVEQRIGRVDRIEQKHRVEVFNLSMQGTIEDRVLDVLEKRIGVFKQTVGGLDEILGGLGGEIEKNMHKLVRVEPDEREQKLQEFAEEIEQARQVLAGEQMQDLLMDPKSLVDAKRSSASPITPEDQERFMENLLRGMGVRLTPKSHGQWQLDFRRSDLDEVGQNCRAVLRPGLDIGSDVVNIENIGFGHPVVESSIEKVLARSWPGNAGGWRLVADSDLRAALGWLFVWEARIPDIKKRKEMVPIFVEDGKGADLDRGRVLVKAAAQFSGGKSIDPASIQMGSLNVAHEVALRYFKQWATEKNAVSKPVLREEIQKARAKSEQYFDQLRRNADAKKQDKARVVEKLRTSGNENDRQVLPMHENQLDEAIRAAKSVEEQRKKRMKALDEKKAQAIAEELVGTYRVEILPPGEAT